MRGFEPADLLDVVRASPRHVSSQDRQAWLALFSDEAAVEDPVGTTPHQRSGAGADPLERFWDTFIAGNDIRFHVHRDLVAGDEVVRDVRIETRFPNGFALEVPAHLRYVLTRQDDGIRIARLAAHWEQSRLLARAATGGPRALGTMTRMGARMVRLQGPSGVAGYLRGLARGIGRHGHLAVHRFADAVGEGDAAGLRRLFGDGGPRLEYPIGTALTPAAFLARGITRFTPSRVTAAGWYASFRFAVESARGPAAGVAFLEFDPQRRRILAARFFVAD